MGPQSGKSGLQRARNFLEKKALGALGVRGFGMEAVDIMEKGVNEKAGDAQILARLRAAWWRHPPKKPANQEGRAQARIKEGAAYFEQERAAAKAPGYRYLDVGCSEGSITAAVVAELGLSPEQAIATDVAFQTSPEGKLIASPAFLFVQVDGSSLPFDDATFDLITMYMSAHHFADARAMFAEAARVAKPGARLILREHGRADPAASLFYDFAHAFYETVAGEESTPEEFAARYARGTYAIYRPLDGWTRLAAVAGFKATDWIPPLKDTFDTLLIRFVREK
jgi:SAM-dependent methyltransferase